MIRPTSGFRVPLGTVVRVERSSVTPDQIATGTAYVGLEDIGSDGRVVHRAVDGGELRSNKFAFTDRHILYGKLRPYLRKVARPNFAGICSTDILPLLPGREVDRDYLFHFLRSPHVVQQATARSEGANLPRLSPATLLSLRIRVPSLDEQRRIVRVLDSADAIRRRRIDSLRVLDELLRSAFLEMFGDPVNNDKGWPTEALGEISTFVGGGTPSRTVPDFWDGPIPWASSKDITSERLTETQEYVTEEGVARSATRIVPPGTILVVVKSKILMHRLPVAVTEVPICFSQDLKAITPPSNGVPAEFLARHLRIGQPALLSKARGANTEGLTLDHLRRYRLMVPPADLLGLWTRIEGRIRGVRGASSKHLTDSVALMDGLVHKTFDS